MGTIVIGDFLSPDGTQDAILIVRNGGAMTGYSTGITLVNAHNPLARQLTLIENMNLFVADDNDGAVRWGDRGQLDMKVSWASNTQLLVQYPKNARIFKQKTSYNSTNVRYVLSQ